MSASRYRPRIEVADMNTELLYFVVLSSLIFSTCVQASGGKLRFVVLGDIGGIPVRPYSMWGQRLVSQRVAKVRRFSRVLCSMASCIFIR